MLTYRYETFCKPSYYEIINACTDKRYNSLLRALRKKQEDNYKDTVLDKKVESLERIENRRLERQMVTLLISSLIHLAKLLVLALQVS